MLNEASGFNRLSKYYEKNKDKPWREWLKIEKFIRAGKQGIVGIAKGKSDESLVYFFKISQYINHLVQHELSVMEPLNEISDFCPHFCRAVGGIIVQVNPDKSDNPFEKGKYMVEKEMLLMEYLDKTYKFYNYIVSDKVEERVLYSITEQIFIALAIAQKHKKLTHYDLHSNNVMIKKCSRDLVLLYVLDDKTQFCVPTNGCIPIIIDYGFSYSCGLDKGPLWPSLNYTECGFMSDRFDPFADPKLFLITVGDEIYQHRGDKKMLNIAKNLYGNLKLDWSSGWDTDTKSCVTDFVLKKVHRYKKISKLFTEYEYYCADLLHSLVILPLEKQSYENYGISYVAFLEEFIKIELNISSPFFCLYILKGIVDCAREVRADYVNKETRKYALDYFRHTVTKRIDSVSNYCDLKTLHHEKMLCSLFCFSKCAEGMLYEAMEKRMTEKRKAYENVPLKTPEEICKLLEYNFDSDYVFSEKTSILVVNSARKTISPISLTESQRDEINSCRPVHRGSELYKMVKNL